MDHLLLYYERQLEALRRDLARFSERNPDAAVRLSISGGQSDDPYVERLLQSFAFLMARIDARLDDDFPEFTESFLNIVYPQYLRPFPSCSVAWFDAQDQFDRMTAPTVLPRGTVFTTKTEQCHFRTLYDVTVAPLRVASAGYAATPRAPASIALPQDTTGLLSLTLETASANLAAPTVPESLRLYLSGAEGTTGSILDAMLLHTAAAYVEDEAGSWTALPQSPLTAVGFADEERLIDDGDASLPFRLLSEYFACPAKFDFVDLNLAAVVRPARAGRRVTLHLAVRNVHRDSWTAQRLAACGADSFRLFCSPVVNLVAMKALPAKRDPVTGVWPVVLAEGSGPQAEVWSVDSVSYQRSRGSSRSRQTIPPFASLSHGDAIGAQGPYWAMRQQSVDGVSRVELALVGSDGQPAETDIEQLIVDVTCSDGSSPQTLEIGSPEGDLKGEKRSIARRITLLSQPTAPARLPVADSASWRLITQCTPHVLQLDRDGLGSIKKLLRTFATLSKARTQFIDRIAGLSHSLKNCWMPGPPQPSLVRGIEVVLTVDEHAFAGKSLVTFASLMERFFASYLTRENVAQLVLRSSNTGVEIWRGAPVSGIIPML